MCPSPPSGRGGPHGTGASRKGCSQHDLTPALGGRQVGPPNTGTEARSLVPQRTQEPRLQLLGANPVS